MQVRSTALMCNTETQESEDEEKSMSRKELERKVHEHIERRKEAYAKMSTVDNK